MRLIVPAGLLAANVAVAVGLVFIAPAPRASARGMAVETVAVADGISMLKGRGGNVGVLVGDDGVLIIDDQYAPSSKDIIAAVGALSEQSIRMVVNTHWHGDHVGGNENMAKDGATIVAHENVHARMSSEQTIAAFGRKVPASPEIARPDVTYGDDGLTLHWGGQTIRVQHPKSAHTDGDSILVFEEANVLHLGDTFFNGTYPFIDASSGGSIDGMIAAAAKALEIAGPETKIIPGHGDLSNENELQAYHDMLVAVRGAIAKLVDAGKSIDEIVAAKPTAEWDEQWGGGFMKADMFTKIVAGTLGAK